MEKQEIVVLTDHDIRLAEESAQVERDIVQARQYPRDLAGVRKGVMEIATVDKETAENCFYSLPRRKKNEKGKYEIVAIEGETVRLAEIVISQWGHISSKKSIINIDKLQGIVTAMAEVKDLQTGNRYTITESKSILYKEGGLYPHDQIILTGKSAASIAWRNAVFMAIPKAFFATILKRVKAVATGAIAGIDDHEFQERTLAERSDMAVKYFTALGVPVERIWGALNIKSQNEMKEVELEHLTGIKTGLKEGEFKLDTAFPPTAKEKQSEKGSEAVSGAINSIPKDK
ncbi:hypothetical protein LCGC14_0501180 [marine sediment metagenome]|uniref:Uncharacterized protein n=1 Tax=marine sediment metagenome TaxID=412755 RepID=A0A0F9VCI9_9ZZZZ